MKIDRIKIGKVKNEYKLIYKWNNINFDRGLLRIFDFYKYFSVVKNSKAILY